MSNDTVNKKIVNKDEILPRHLRIVSTNKIEWLLKIPATEIKMLAESEIIPYARDEEGNIVKGRFDILDVTQAVIAFNNKNAKLGSVKSLAGQFEHSKVMKIQAQAEREVIHNQMMKGSIVRIEDVNAEVLDMILAIKGKLMGFPSHVARLILGKEDFDEVCAILTDCMEQALYDLQPPNSEAVRARNRRLTKFTEALPDDGEESDQPTHDTEALFERKPSNAYLPTTPKTV